MGQLWRPETPWVLSWVVGVGETHPLQMAFAPCRACLLAHRPLQLPATYSSGKKSLLGLRAWRFFWGLLSVVVIRFLIREGLFSCCHVEVTAQSKLSLLPLLLLLLILGLLGCPQRTPFSALSILLLVLAGHKGSRGMLQRANLHKQSRDGGGRKVNFCSLWEGRPCRRGGVGEAS